MAQNAIDYIDEKENVSKSETHITASSSPSLHKERYSSSHLAKSLEPAAFTTSDESGMFEDDETMESLSAHDRTFVRTPTDSSRIQLSPESFRESRHAHGSIHMAPRFPEGLDFWKPPGTGSLFAKLYQSWTQETAVSPAEAEDNSRVMFRSAASLFFRKGFAALLRNETPGPGYYNPSIGEQLRFPRMPSFTIRRKLKCPKKEPTPAPWDYSPDKADPLVRPMSPSYTFGHKGDCCYCRSTSPAPGAYCPEKADTVLAVTPAYTFGIKPKDAKPDDIPAPGAYRPEKADSVLVRTPAYTFGARPKDSRNDGVPAPGKYNVPGTDTYKSKSPAYTLSYRTNIPSDHTKKPGPGAHSPERVWMNKSSSPRFTFGIRHSPVAETPKPK
uniref:Neuroproteinsis n=1 Tax=Rhipicephalus zambeziensis TaxID=60191 RepID=A0A224Z4W4_9ACAR